MDDVQRRLDAALADRYRIERELGRGGMGRVYLAEDLKHRRRVAIKVLTSELGAAFGRDRFLREIETSARLTHPHILPLHDSGETDAFLYYVMPYVEGETLGARLKREGPLPVDEAVQLATEVADALAYAHRNGVVHRDIKPENILLAEGHAHVADFGVARAVSLAGGKALTGTGVAVGTPLYMSPEQVVGDPSIDGRSDIYSLGCVLYEMLAGTPPFTADTVEGVVRRHLTEPPVPLNVHRDVPDVLARTVRRALAKSPSDRFADAQDFARELRGVTTSGAAVLASRRQRRDRWITVGAVVAALGVIGWYVVQEPGGRPPQRFESLAVLPLENIGPDSAESYFADGMTEAIIAGLAQIEGLRVISRTSVMQYRNARRPLREIAAELGVDAVVEGTVLRIGPEVRVTAQLVDAATDRHLWAQVYQRRLEDVLGLQMDLAGAIAREIQVTLSPAVRARLGGARQVDPAAYEAYLRGRFHWNKRTPAGFRAAIREFERAIELDPTYAAAYSGLADSYILLVEWQVMPPPEGVPRAKSAVREALRRDSLLAEAHTSLGEVRISEWDWVGAEQAFRRAIELNPGYPTAHQWYGYFLSKMGRHDEAIAELRRALELDPLSRVIHTELARVFYHARRYDSALAAIERAADLDSTFIDLAWMRAQVLEQRGRYAEAITAFRTGAGAIPVGAEIARVQATMGRPEAARRTLDSVIADARRTGAYLAPATLAEVHWVLGERDRAIELLEQAFATGVDDRLSYLKVLPTLDPMRDDPRFQDLLRRMQFPPD